VVPPLVGLDPDGAPGAPQGRDGTAREIRRERTHPPVAELLDGRQVLVDGVAIDDPVAGTEAAAAVNLREKVLADGDQLPQPRQLLRAREGGNMAIGFHR
jgi:hypothetical protein